MQYMHAHIKKHTLTEGASWDGPPPPLGSTEEPPNRPDLDLDSAAFGSLMDAKRDSSPPPAAAAAAPAPQRVGPCRGKTRECVCVLAPLGP
jgi:hypothetical protein